MSLRQVVRGQVVRGQVVPVPSPTDTLHKSIYYFHCDDELLAWRTIGIAAREALEMGLHRRKSLFDNFKDPDTRRLATRVFWCVYVLDRRWSFGTSLSFALSDRDIDAGLPEPVSRLLFSSGFAFADAPV